MPFVSAKCTCCGAEITVDDTKEALICEHCNSAFIVEKAIELYSELLKTTPDSFEYLFNLASAYKLANNTEKAMNPPPTVGVPVARAILWISSEGRSVFAARM